MSDGILLVVIGLTFLFYSITREEDTHIIRKKWYTVLTLMFVLASIKSVILDARVDSLTDTETMWEAFYSGFVWIIFLEIFIAFIETVRWLGEKMQGKEERTL